MKNDQLTMNNQPIKNNRPMMNNQPIKDDQPTMKNNRPIKIALIDNYDSFTYNLYHLLKELGADVTVWRNDAFQLTDLEAFDKLILSPGPGLPSEAGLLLPVIRTYAGRIPILGVCLGEQAIGEAFGARLTNLRQVFHGIQSIIQVSQLPTQKAAKEKETEAAKEAEGTKAPDYLFRGLPQQLPVGRYHSWIVDDTDFPDCLEVTARSAEGYIMALRHRQFDVHGIQFHPESILTPDGKALIRNFLQGE